MDDESAAFVRRKNDKTLHPPIARPAADYGDEADDEPELEGRRPGLGRAGERRVYLIDKLKISEVGDKRKYRNSIGGREFFLNKS